MNLNSITKYTVATTIVILLLLSIWPWIHKEIEKKDVITSLQSIKQAGENLKRFEEDHKTLPPAEKWVIASNEYSPYSTIVDPLFSKKDKNPPTPGWAMNGRLGLSYGSRAENDEALKKSTGEKLTPPDNAILLLPSKSIAVYPYRNGKIPYNDNSISENTEIEITKEEIEKPKRLGAIFSKLGISDLYLTVGGEILQLTPEEAAEKLKLRKKPELYINEIETSKIETPIENIKWEKREDQNTNNKNTEIEITKEESTYLIPLPTELLQSTQPTNSTTTKNIVITTEIKTEDYVGYEIIIEFFNKNKYKINIDNNKTPQPIKYVFSEGLPIYTEDPLKIEVGKKVGINPEEGHAQFTPTITKTSTPPKKSANIKVDPSSSEDSWITKTEAIPASFQQGTLISETKNYDISKTETYIAHDNKNEWKESNITITTKDIPEHTKYIKLKIRNLNSETTKIVAKQPKAQIVPNLPSTQ